MRRRRHLRSKIRSVPAPRLHARHRIRRHRAIDYAAISRAEGGKEGGRSQATCPKGDYEWRAVTSSNSNSALSATSDDALRVR